MRSCQRGFTLIEIMVVVAIVGIATGIAFALAAPDSRAVALRDAREFARGLDYATRAAQWHQQLLGISADGDRIRYWRRDSGSTRWLEAGDAALRSRKLPGAAVVRALDYAGRPIAANSVVPLHPTGRNEPFTFAVDAGGWRARVASDPLNRISIAGPTRLAP
ncbi:MAG: prepilin-type N-terminal cleavage/methylation domain-containing protein [Proteobacteria bacterium]|jgi:type II secretion system protein H|nr:prepilin-type N-terminal cleavage/methylation domain-containing protein [Pseudomonadota bacterium]